MYMHRLQEQVIYQSGTEVFLKVPDSSHVLIYHCYE